MKSPLNTDAKFPDNLESSSAKRAFAARLDMTIKRAKITSGRLARLLAVPERDVTFWRAGVMTPHAEHCHKLSDILGVDFRWLCAGTC
jgi:hypothetical protein